LASRDNLTLPRDRTDKHHHQWRAHACTAGLRPGTADSALERRPVRVVRQRCLRCVTSLPTVPVNRGRALARAQYLILYSLRQIRDEGHSPGPRLARSGMRSWRICASWLLRSKQRTVPSCLQGQGACLISSGLHPQGRRRKSLGRQHERVSSSVCIDWGHGDTTVD
jgi:hypothetical protein